MTNSENHELIWILDNEATAQDLYLHTLGLQYGVRTLQSVEELLEALRSPPADPKAAAQPHLLIVDPEHTQGSFSEILALQNKAGAASAQPRLPEYMIATRDDSLETMRFFLRVGARDYIVKPLRPNEVVAKVERAIYQVSNREVIFLRSDLDGLHVPDLTFREHQMLTIFLKFPARRVSREDLHIGIWGRANVNKKTLDVHLFNLRRKLRPLGYDVIFEGQVFSLCKTGAPPTRRS